MEKEDLEELDKEMVGSYDVCINTARDKREKFMWKHRKEGWELAMKMIRGE